MKRKWALAQWAEIRWWRRYLKNRSPEAYASWKFDYWSQFLARLNLSPAPGAHVLDAGCGPAGIFIALPHCRVDAVDPLLDQYRMLPHFQADRYPWTRFISQPLERFAGGDYDLAFCLNALNHMHDIPRSVQQLHALLKPGGCLVVSVDVHRRPPLKWLFRLMPMDVLHPFQETLAGYEKLFLEAGFEEKRRICYKKGRIFDYWVIIFNKNSYLKKN